MARGVRALGAPVLSIGGAGTLDARVAAFLKATLEFFERKREFFEHCHQEMTPAVRKKAKQQFGQVFAAQTETAKFLATFKDYPPSQRAASFSIDQIQQKLQDSLNALGR